VLVGAKNNNADSCNLFYFVGELQLRAVTETTYKDHFTESPFTSSQFGKAASFEGVHGSNR